MPLFYQKIATPWTQLHAYADDKHLLGLYFERPKNHDEFSAKPNAILKALQNQLGGGKTGQRTTSSSAKQDSINNALLNLINSCCTKSGQTNAGTANTGATLLQNIPNPFSQTTSIKCFIPSNSKASSLLVFDMNGTLKKTIPISGTGDITLAINGKELIAGMYYYTLVIDNNEIDTKKMILTEQ